MTTCLLAVLDQWRRTQFMEMDTPTPGDCTNYKGVPEGWQFFFHELSGLNDFSMALKA